MAAFLGEPQIDTLYNAWWHREVILLAAVCFFCGTPRPVVVGKRVVEMVFQKHAHE